jgi:alcohol dehydrogenase class IV
MPDVTLRLPSQIVLSGGCSDEVASAAAGRGMTRPLVVTDPYLAHHGPLGDLLARLDAAGLAAAVYGAVRPDPTTSNVDEALDLVREHDADGVIAVGGGSSLDVGKAVAVMATNPGVVSDYAGYSRVPSAGLPVIGIPTTAGTGSEVTRVSVITDSDRSVKMMLLDDHLLCSVALVDYRLTLSCPRELTAHVGIDSLTHAIEAYVSRLANPVTDLWAVKAARLIAPNLRQACENPDDGPAREALTIGATLAGMAFSNASVALVHGMSRPLGAHFHLTHGLSNAVLLPEVTRYSVPAAQARYAALGRALDFAAADDDNALAADKLVDGLARLNHDLGIPRLRHLGVERTHFDAVKHDMAAAALESGSPGFNPRIPDADEIIELYEKVY